MTRSYITIVRHTADGTITTDGDRCGVISGTGHWFLSHASWESAFRTARDLCKHYGYAFKAGGLR
jgi:hypothetical protein